jgi:MFS family permease
LMISGGAMGAGIAALAFAGSYAALIIALIVLHAVSGLYDVGINAARVDLEKATGRRLMAVLHAAFSAGGVVGALSAGALLSTGVDYRHVCLGVLLPLGVVILAVATIRLPPPGESPDNENRGERPGLYRNLPLLLIAVIATLALLSQGEMEPWSGVYLRQTLGLSALLGGSGDAVFYGAMVAGPWEPPSS